MNEKCVVVIKELHEKNLKYISKQKKNESHAQTDNTIPTHRECVKPKIKSLILFATGKITHKMISTTHTSDKNINRKTE